MVKQRLRRGDEPPPYGAVVVRGLSHKSDNSSLFSRAQLVADADTSMDFYGFAGLSAWLVTPDWPLQRILEEKLARAQRVALIPVEGLSALGLTAWDTGAAPHVHLVALDGGLDTLVDGIMAISCASMDDSYYASEESS